MSSRREVLIRIFALLQRKTLIETKNCTLKCLKWHYSTMRSMKNVAVFTEDGAFALFFRPHPGGFDSSRVPTPGNLPSKAKKMLMPGGVAGEGGGWAQLELTDAKLDRRSIYASIKNIGHGKFQHIITPSPIGAHFEIFLWTLISKWIKRLWNIYTCVAVNFLSQVIFIFLLFQLH